MNVEVMPELIGGMNKLYKNLLICKEAEENNIEGIVKTRAFIEKKAKFLKNKLTLLRTFYISKRFFDKKVTQRMYYIC